MFGFLKKKIKESIDGIAKAVAKKPAEEPAKEENFPEKPGEMAETEETHPEITAVEQPQAATNVMDAGEAANKPVVTEAIEEEREIEIGAEPEMGQAIEKVSAEKHDVLAEKPKSGIFGKIAEKFTKKITEVTVKEEDIEPIIDNLKIGLMENDVALEVAEKICDSVEKDLTGKSVKRSKVAETVKDSLRRSVSEILAQKKINIVEFVRAQSKPALILFIGFNGAGKTTTLARIGNYLKNRGVNCVFAAGDSFRAASIEQIQVHGDRLGIKVIRHNYGADSAAVIFDAMKYAASHNIDVVLADTAGRTHVNANLMDELKKVCRVNKPAMKILVLDSLTGNDIVEQASKFDEAVGVDALVFTKADVYEKGGAILSAAHTIRKPVLFLGVGQNYEDLEEFDTDKVVERIFN